MTGKTHMIVGVASLGCLWVAFPGGININNQTVMPQIAILTAAIGSYLPDIDIPTSKLGKKYSFISKRLTHRKETHRWYFIPAILFVLMSISVLLPSQYTFVLNIVLLLVTGANSLRVVHKLLTKGNADLDDLGHIVCGSYSALTIMQDFHTTLVFCSMLFGLWFGWMMHIFADFCNGKGVPLLPGSNNKHIMSVTTGTWQETLWLVCYLLLVVGATAWKVGAFSV